MRLPDTDGSVLEQLESRTHKELRVSGKSEPQEIQGYHGPTFWKIDSHFPDGKEEGRKCGVEMRV